VTPAAAEPSRLAFKAYEIEELADVYFFRPLGMVFARLARTLGLTPTAVTLVATAFGIAGGAMLASPRLALAAFFVIIFHSVLDSSDGQLARMTGTSSEFGRMLDGIGGYLTHIAIYAGILAGVRAQGSLTAPLAVAVAAALSNVVHAQMYDYHRTAYADVVIKGRIRDHQSAHHHGVTGSVLTAYERMERTLAGRHGDVQRAIAARRQDGSVADADRARYRALFYWPVRGWNFLGDNTRFYAIGIVAWLQHVEWFFGAVLSMNIALVALWWIQARADRQFLRAL
jgi:hypothetical protein